MKLENINTEELIREITSGSTLFKVKDSVFLKKGYAGWPTLFITVNVAEGLYHLVYMICESIDLSKKIQPEDLELFIKEIKSSKKTYWVIEKKKHIRDITSFPPYVGFLLINYLNTNKVGFSI